MSATILPYTAKKQMAESYYISVTGMAWAYFYITATGEIFIHSDWGYYCYSYKHFDGDFKQFVATSYTSYLLDGFERNYLDWALAGPLTSFSAEKKKVLTGLIDCFRTELKKELASEDANWVTLKNVSANLREIEYKASGNPPANHVAFYEKDKPGSQVRFVPGTADFKFRFIIPFYDAGSAEAILGWFQVWAMDGKEAIIEGTVYSPPGHRDNISSIRFDNWPNQVEVDDIFGGTLPFREIVQQAYNQYLKQKQSI